MIYYEKEVQKAIRKGDIPKPTLKLFHHAFQSLELTKDLNLFDIKKLKGNFKRDYLRLRKGKYRAIFYIDDDIFYIIYIGKRDEVYESWL
jgi:mRNA interferase RelE/StbE